MYGKTEKENMELYLNTEEYPLDYQCKVSDDLNGANGNTIHFADIGCGYGGLLMALGEHFPDKLSFGVEIRDKAVNFVGEKIRSKRHDSKNTQVFF